MATTVSISGKDMRLVDQGVIYDAEQAPPERRSCAFTSLVTLRDGSYRCSFRAALGRDIPGGKLRIMGSEHGSDWNVVHPGLSHVIDGIEGDLYAGYLAELEPGVLTGSFVWVDRSDPNRSFVHPETAGVLEMRNLIAVSTDGGATWSGWQEVELGPEAGCSCTGPIFEIESGVLAFPYETWKSYEDPRPGSHTASLRLSRDNGRTWNERIIVAADPDERIFFWDQRIAVHPGTGELVAMFWTHDRQAGADIDNHIAWSSGATEPWSRPASTGWAGQHCQPLALGGYRLAAIHTERTARGGIIVRLSEDFGRTWRDDSMLRIYEPAAAASSDAESFEEFWQSMMTWPFGHPRAVVTPDGDILGAWYAGSNDVIGMRWARVAIA
ncbi:MAG: exo-alpha-sialidase [Thermomicrobiales bacterium]|nr:exo-alpha-sialidase [Thermomicrobiales bacterium]MCO5220341.1 glycoside hydrolase [Thermomicrobiales bacterium]